MGYTDTERGQVKLEFLRMLSRMELNPAKTELLYGFFETYLKLDETEENQMMERITNLPEKEMKNVLRLPNSYFDKGVEKGKREGKQEGIQEGKWKGKQEVAIKLLSRGMPIKHIVEVTGLPWDVIEKLANTR